MKKNIKYLAFAAVTLLSAVSCQDAIDIVQDGEITEGIVFNSSDNLEKYLNGAVYGSLDNSSQIYFTSVFTDELRIGPSSVGGDVDLLRYVITPNNRLANSMWSGRYTTIKRVNTLIHGSTLFTPQTAEQTAQYNNAIAEARALRALAYIDLLAYFSTNMKDNSALGVMLTTSPAEVGDVLPRATNGEIWQVVEEDLDYAYANVNAAHQASAARNNSYFITKAAISAIKARMFVYRGMYPQAKAAAEAAIAESGSALTVATPIPTGTPGSSAWNTAFYAVAGGNNPYRRLWVDAAITGASDENIFKLSRPATGSGGIGGLWTTNQTNLNGSPQWTIGLNLFAALNNTTADIRRYAFIDPSSTGNDYVIDKYPGKGNTPLKNDIKMFRLSEMYLILAECAAQTDLGLAASYIQQLRNARVYAGTATLPVYANKTAALRDILLERRVELALEGHRYIDLKRLGVEAGVGIDRNALDDKFSSTTPLTLSPTDYRFTLPIPSSEINGNPAIASQQNPGYN